MRFSKCALLLVVGLVCVGMAGGYWLVPVKLDASNPAVAVDSASHETAIAHKHTDTCQHGHVAPRPVIDDQPPGDLTAFVDAPDEVRETLQFCFAEGTPPEEIEYYHNLIFGDSGPPGEAGPRYVLGQRWSGTAGTPRNLTWSLVPDGTAITDSTGGTSNLFSQMDSYFAAQGGRATWINRIQQCFDRWEELSGLTFTRITVGGNDWDDGASWPFNAGSATRGDIRIAGRTFSPSGVLAYAYLPGSSAAGDVLMNMQSNLSNAFNQNRYFRNILMHELGHSIGIQHICSSNASHLMEPFINTGFDGPRHDDIRAVQRHYGDPYENDNTPAAANHIGTVEVGSPIFLGTLPPPPTGTNPINSSLISLDTGAKVDFFRFTVNGPREATVTISPQGFTYDSQTQLSNGNCPACCNNINTLTLGNLDVQIYDTNGSTVLGTGNSSPAGVPETLSGVLLPAAGDYYIRVFSPGSFFQTQLYTVNLSVEQACELPNISPIANDSTVCDVPYTSPTPVSPGAPPLSWSFDSSVPPGMTIHSGTGVVSWPSPVASYAGYDITVKVETGCGDDDTQTFHLAVMPGDFTGDGVVTLLDVADFVDHLLGFSSSAECAADTNLDGFVDGLDVQAFVDSLVP